MNKKKKKKDKIAEKERGKQRWESEGKMTEKCYHFSVIFPSQEARKKRKRNEKKKKTKWRKEKKTKRKKWKRKYLDIKTSLNVLKFLSKYLHHTNR